MSDRPPLTIGTVLRALRTPVTLIVLLCILGYAAWWGYERVTEPLPPPQRDPCVPQAIEKGQLQSAQVTVRVYNGGTERGLAGDVAASLRSKGFQVSTVGNTDEKITKTVIVAQGKDNPETKLVLGFFKGATVREDPNRVDHGIDVLVGDAETGWNAKAPSSLEVKSATVCLPKLPSEQTG